MNTSIPYGKHLFILYRTCDLSALVVHCCPACIVGSQSSPVTVHRNQGTEPSLPSISYSTNELQPSMSVPTAPLESPREHQPYSESGYIFADSTTKDDPPSYAEAISTQNSPRPGTKE